MIYEVDNYHDLIGKDFYFTLDGELVPVCQFADTERGIVRFAAMTDDYALYFDFEREEYCILERTGLVEVHVVESPQALREQMLALIPSGRFLKPFPYEMTEGMRSVGRPLIEYAIGGRVE